MSGAMNEGVEVPMAFVNGRSQPFYPLVIGHIQRQKGWALAAILLHHVVKVFEGP